MNYTCANCEKDSGIEMHARPGIGAGLLVGIGWLMRNPCLYTGKAGEWFAYCGTACKEAHYPGILSERASPEVIAEVSAKMEALKNDLKKLGRPL